MPVAGPLKRRRTATVSGAVAIPDTDRSKVVVQRLKKVMCGRVRGIEWSVPWRNAASKHVRLPAGWRPPACLTMDTHDGTLTTGVVQARLPGVVCGVISGQVMTGEAAQKLLRTAEQVAGVVAMRAFDSHEFRAGWGELSARFVTGK